MDIGVVGLGPMGAAMARRLLQAGHVVTVYNRTAERTEPLVQAGARRAASPAEAAGGDIVLTSLANDAAVETLVLGEQGVVAGLKPGAIHLSASTISIALADRLGEAHRDRRQGYVASPVLGRPPAAEAGALYVMAAGEASAIERVRGVLEVIGQRVFVVGERPSQANLVKLCANFLIFSTIEQLSEVFAITEKDGIDRNKVFEVLTGSFYSAPVHKNYGKLIVERAFDPPGAKVGLGAKDTNLMLAAGEQLSVPMPFADIVHDRFLATLARGEGNLDFACIARRAEEDAGLR